MIKIPRGDDKVQNCWSISSGILWIKNAISSDYDSMISFTENPKGISLNQYRHTWHHTISMIDDWQVLDGHIDKKALYLSHKEYNNFILIDCCLQVLTTSLTLDALKIVDENLRKQKSLKVNSKASNIKYTIALHTYKLKNSKSLSNLIKLSSKLKYVNKLLIKAKKIQDAM